MIATVRDRTKREHVAAIDRVIWSDAEQPVSILALADGLTVVVQDEPDKFTRGVQYRFLGRWEEGRRGPQFRASTWVVHLAHSHAGIVKYLSDVCSGIGKSTAAKLADRYGSEATRILRENPQQVADDGLMTIDAARAAAEDLARFAGMERTRIDLFGLFAGRGFPGKLVERAMSKWGCRAPEVITADPFRLLTNRLPGCGWKRCDKLYLDQGGRRDALKRQFLAGWNALREDRTGSTWVDADRVVEAIREAVPGPTCDPLRAIKLGLRAGWLRLLREGRKRWLAVTDHARDEQRIATAVRRLLGAATDWPTDLPETTAESDGLPSRHQNEHLRAATVGTVGCFTGGPGSGKTHTLSFLLRAVIAAHGADCVAIAAPTGKAAVRATESLSERNIAIRATTIHRLLEVGRNGHDGQGWGFQRNADNPLPCRFLVVDEASMIDTGLMAELLDACATGTHVLFVGDPFQLPPVGHGAPLRDLIASGVVGVGELTEIRRNAGGIVRGCAAIKAGLPVPTAEMFDLDAADPANLRLIESPPDAALDLVEDVLRNLSRFDAVWDTQIITALNEKSAVARKAVNERLARLLNPDGKRAAGCPFAVGDKVACLRNSQLRSVVPIGQFGRPDMSEDTGNYQTNGRKETEFVANGELGRVVAVSDKECVIAFGDRTVAIPVRKQRQADDDDGEAGPTGALGDFDLAYGLTVHKSQGSEWPLVIAIIDPAGGAVADRNFWYTAISRARTACLLVGDRSAFVTQCSRQSLARRKTFLVELLRGES